MRPKCHDGAKTSRPIKGKMSSTVWPFSNNIISIFCRTSNDILKQMCCCWWYRCCCCYCSGNCEIFLETIIRRYYADQTHSHLHLHLAMPMSQQHLWRRWSVYARLPSVIQAISFRFVSFRLALVLFRFQCGRPLLVGWEIYRNSNKYKANKVQHTVGNCTII